MTGDTDRPDPSFASNQQLSEKMRAKDILHAFWDGWMDGWWDGVGLAAHGGP